MSHGVPREAPERARPARATRTHVPGLGSYFTRGPGYWIAYYRDGQEQRESVARLTGIPPERTTPKDALRCLRERKRQVWNGTFVGTATARLTVSAVLDAYLRHCASEGGRKALTDIRNECAHLRAGLGPVRAGTVDLLLLEDYAARAKAAGFAPGTVKKRLSYLRAAFRYSKRARLISLVPEFPTLEDSPPRRGFFDPAEFAALLRHADGVFAELFEAYYLTGWRRDELLGLAWTQVDRLAGVVRLPDSKNGEGRVVPLRGRLKDIFDQRWAARTTRRWNRTTVVSPWVFHGPLGGRIHEDRMYEAWHAATRAAGLAGRIPHDLRRTVARDGIASGGDYKSVMALTGHKTLAVFKRYQIAMTREIERVQDQVAAFRRTAHGHEADTSRPLLAQVRGKERVPQTSGS